MLAAAALLTGVLGEGAVIAAAGIVTGIAGGSVLARLVGGYLQDVRLPGVLTIRGAALLLVAAAIVASLIPAARASRVDVMQALRSDQTTGTRGACAFQPGRTL